VEKGEKNGTIAAQVIIAALDEEEGIGLTIAELKEYLDGPRILVVDGRSRDKTVHAAKTMGAGVIFQSGRGKGDAISYALRYIDSGIEYVVLTDADFTYPAEYIPQMIKILEENPNVGMVCGNRFNLRFRLRGMHDIFYFGNRLLAIAHNMLNGVALKDPLTGLRVVRAEILRDWNPVSKDFDIEVELNHHVEHKGFSIVEVPIAYRKRLGEKKLKLSDGSVILKRMITEFLLY
jgi:dolichol-phosphate mannosyltransferase